MRIDCVAGSSLTVTYAVFGRKLLTHEQVLTHFRTSEKVKSPYGLRVISTADGSLLPERIEREIAHVPAFNESISTVNGRPHGNILYSWNSGFWWLRKEIRRRLGQTGPDPVDAAVDAKLGVVRDGGLLRLEPREASATTPR